MRPHSRPSRLAAQELALSSPTSLRMQAKSRQRRSALRAVDDGGDAKASDCPKDSTGGRAHKRPVPFSERSDGFQPSRHRAPLRECVLLEIISIINLLLL